MCWRSVRRERASCVAASDHFSSLLAPPSQGDGTSTAAPDLSADTARLLPLLCDRIAARHRATTSALAASPPLPGAGVARALNAPATKKTPTKQQRPFLLVGKATLIRFHRTR